MPVMALSAHDFILLFFHCNYPSGLSDCLQFTAFFLGPFLLSYAVFVFSFSVIFFFSVPCARLSWPYRQLLTARKYIVSCRILFGGAT